MRLALALLVQLPREVTVAWAASVLQATEVQCRSSLWNNHAKNARCKLLANLNGPAPNPKYNSRGSFSDACEGVWSDKGRAPALVGRCVLVAFVSKLRFKLKDSGLEAGNGAGVACILFRYMARLRQI